MLSARSQVRRFHSHETVAFRNLYKRYATLIYRYTLVKTGQKEVAEELTTRVFVEAWQTFPSFGEFDTSLGGSLLRIAHRLIHDRHRWRWRIGGKLLRWWNRFRFRNNCKTTSVRQAYRLRGTLFQLPFEEDITIHLHVFEGYSFDEIAGMLRKSTEAVQLFKSRAVHQLYQVW